MASGGRANRRGVPQSPRIADPYGRYACLCLGFMPVAPPQSPRLHGALEDRTGIFRALRRRRGLILTIALLVAVVVVVASLQRDPSYRSAAVVLVRPVSLPDGSSPSAVNMATEEELVQSPDVVAKVQRTLRGPVSSDELVRDLDVARSEREDAQVLLLTYVGADPDEARERVQAFADAYLESRRAQALSALRVNQQALKESIPLLEAQTRSLTHQAASTSDRVRRRSLLQQAGLLRGQVIARETLLTGAHPTPDVGSVVQMASAATEVPIPGPIAVGAVGLLLGLAAGVTVAAIGTMDNRPADASALERLVGTPALATVPHIPLRRSRGPSRLVTIADPASTGAEAYRVMRTILANRQTKLLVLLVTSADTDEGKSTVAANLAVSLAESGSRVVLVDCNLRRPAVAELFGGRGDPGLVHVLAGTVGLAGAVRSTAVDGLEILPAGRQSSRTAEILASPRLSSIVEAASRGADLVILDGPAVREGLDALSLALVADGVLLVADAGLGDADAIIDARVRLEGVGAPMVGAVLNDVRG